MSISAIKRIENKARSMPGAISLAQGVPSFFSSELIRKNVIKKLEENKVDRYSPPAGIPELRNFISQKLSKQGMDYSPESEILITVGAIEGLSASLLALAKPEDEIIILTPSYPYYSRITEMIRAKAVSIPLDENKNWSLDIEKLKEKINKKTKAIILCSPNNPTGTVLPKETLLEIGKIAKENNIFIIIDDVYQNFHYGAKEIFNLCAQPELKNLIIRIVSFSKDFAIPGWRIGYLHSSKENIERIQTIHDNIVNCAPVISQYAALAGMENEKTLIDEYVKEYKIRRDIMVRYLKKLENYMAFVIPEGAYYIFPKVLSITKTEDLCFDILEKEKVAVVPGEDFGLGGKGHIRLCFSKSREEIKEGMSKLISYFAKNDIKKFG